ncbi:MAG: hypothetical protein WCX12_03865 [Candidatus Paceibacterota bacterium]|jgi:hypothetical protein
MKLPPFKVGFLQAAGLTIYVGLFATILTQSADWIKTLGIEPSPVISITTFLLAFIISALICSSIAFGYSALLFLRGQKQPIPKIILWTAIWLIVFLLIFLFVNFVIL